MSLILAAGGYALAAATDDEVALMGETFLERAQERLLEETSVRVGVLSQTSGREELRSAYEAGVEALRFKLDRETRALATLSRLGGAESDRFRKELQNAGGRAEETLATYYRRRGGGTAVAVEGTPSLRGRTAPEKTGALTGPLTMDFLRERLGRALSDEESALFARHPYAVFEAWNFADGARSLDDIRGALSAELGETQFGDVQSFFAALERAGLVRQRSLPEPP